LVTVSAIAFIDPSVFFNSDDRLIFDPNTLYPSTDKKVRNSDEAEFPSDS